MRLDWSEKSLLDLEALDDRAPRQATRVYDAIQDLVRQPFPAMYRQVREREGEHVLSVPPHAVFYEISGDSLTLITIQDCRRRQQPW